MFQSSTLADDRLPSRSHTPCYLNTQKPGEGFHPLPFGLSLIFSNLAEKNQRLDWHSGKSYQPADVFLP
ncbi:hypothetical protein H6F78_12710 [Coleofasciculus sp. FACHB-64]|nr:MULTISPECIES: hypothetical protein [unclassified Coleofasciculus]MBD1840163.1 hypothetical protein [Coleofasciculus sp. FACHB-501]MBD1887739.1 hypothetical protein [Coleofasciculus sp. FACHB-SPT9]MBD1901673.1 hypothetical protein [Coleofasciculus sp. FACHB-125]MBD1941467.1 hypothetical protein [Coleofasciculus sp. FACHB-712]MBD2046442.1 hypothetical protein [Coleofasciculus sp. FACHB-64]